VLRAIKSGFTKVALLSLPAREEFFNAVDKFKVTFIHIKWLALKRITSRRIISVSGFLTL